ncbi:MAG TPA: site-specific integrase [Ruminiclostridium sp.]
MQAESTGQKIVQQFNQYLQEDGKASSTVESYAGDIAAFVAWLEEK